MSKDCACRLPVFFLIAVTIGHGTTATSSALYPRSWLMRSAGNPCRNRARLHFSDPASQSWQVLERSG